MKPIKIKKRTKKQHRFINGAKGALSLFLCIVLMPMLSIAAALIEFSRYQEAINATEEIAEASILSTLANYDSYLEERFALFSVSQDCNVDEEFKTIFGNNVGLMGGAVTSPESTKASGISPLSETSVLEQQILDFSETTGLIEIAMKQFKLEQLLEKLNELSGMGNILDGVSTVVDVTDAMKNLVDAAEALYNLLDGLKGKMQNFPVQARDLVRKIAEMYEKVYNGFGKKPDVEDFVALVDPNNEYLSGIIDIYGSVDGLLKEVDQIIQGIAEVPSTFNALKTAFQNAKDAMQQNKNSKPDFGENEGENEAEQEAQDPFESFLNEIEKVIEDVQTEFIEDTKDAAKNMVEKFKTSLKENLGLDKIADPGAYFNIITIEDENGNVTYKISDNAEETLKDLFSLFDVNNFSSENFIDIIISNIQRVLFPDGFVDFNLDSIVTSFKNALEGAADLFTEAIEASFFKLINTLVSAIRNLFKMDVFVNNDMKAVVSSMGGDNNDNPAQRMLNALDKITGSDSDDDDEDLNWYERIKRFLERIKGIIDGAKEFASALGSMISETVQGIAEFITDSAIEKYKKFLISGYAVNNFPNRLSGGSPEYSADGVTLPLEGAGLTGFAFNDIVREPHPQNASYNANSFVGAELEYILQGSRSEEANQMITFMALYMIRMLMDAPAVFMDSAVGTMAAAATVASWVVYLLVLAAEPFVDVILLVNGGTAPLLKSKCYLTITGLPKLIGVIGTLVTNNDTIEQEFQNIQSDLEDAISKKGGTVDNNFSTGTLDMDYKTHCFILLLFKRRERVLENIAALVEMEARAKYGQDKFNIENAYSQVAVETTIGFNSFINIFEIDGGVFKKNYTITRGY